MLSPLDNHHFGLYILKVTARCNLDCDYCYVFHKGDDTWQLKPRAMSPDCYAATLQRIAEETKRSALDSVRLTFHGGEPTLVGVRRFDAMCAEARSRLEAESIDVRLTLQTNGTRLNSEWADVLARHRVNIGVSIDGDRATHDAHRVDHAGRGSYDRVAAGLAALREASLPFGLLCVIPLGADPLAVHASLMSHEPAAISYILPDFSHDEFASGVQGFGPHPVSDFLIPVFDAWIAGDPLAIPISPFVHMARLILGGPSHTDTLGNGSFGYIVVETNGDIEGLDCLKVCAPGIAQSGLTVVDNAFADVFALECRYASTIFGETQLPTGCIRCPEADTCGGGYLPHRYSAERGFDNPSVWCQDLLAVFGHMRRRLDIDPELTARRRKIFAELSA